MGADTGADTGLSTVIGRRVRSARPQRGWTLDDHAERSGAQPGVGAWCPTPRGRRASTPPNGQPRLSSTP